MRRVATRLGTGFLALLVATCGSPGAATQSGPAATLNAESPLIIARNSTFTTADVTAPADRAFTIDFDNQDSAPHNVVIQSDAGRVAFKGEVFSGSAHRIYSVDPLPAGRYTFKCEVHPVMTGTLTLQ